jgi:hypothetical protein
MSILGHFLSFSGLPLSELRSYCSTIWSTLMHLLSSSGGQSRILGLFFLGGQTPSTFVCSCFLTGSLQLGNLNFLILQWPCPVSFSFLAPRSDTRLRALSAGKILPSSISLMHSLFGFSFFFFSSTCFFFSSLVGGQRRFFGLSHAGCNILKCTHRVAADAFAYFTQIALHAFGEFFGFGGGYLFVAVLVPVHLEAAAPHRPGINRSVELLLLGLEIGILLGLPRTDLALRRFLLDVFVTELAIRRIGCFLFFAVNLQRKTPVQISQTLLVQKQLQIHHEHFTSTYMLCDSVASGSHLRGAVGQPHLGTALGLLLGKLFALVAAGHALRRVPPFHLGAEGPEGGRGGLVAPLGDVALAPRLRQHLLGLLVVGDGPGHHHLDGFGEGVGQLHALEGEDRIGVRLRHLEPSETSRDRTYCFDTFKPHLWLLGLWPLLMRSSSLGSGSGLISTFFSICFWKYSGSMEGCRCCSSIAAFTVCFWEATTSPAFVGRSTGLVRGWHTLYRKLGFLGSCCSSGTGDLGSSCGSEMRLAGVISNLNEKNLRDWGMG